MRYMIVVLALAFGLTYLMYDDGRCHSCLKHLAKGSTESLCQECRTPSCQFCGNKLTVADGRWYCLCPMWRESHPGTLPKLGLESRDVDAIEQDRRRRNARWSIPQ
jgi:hypothetical protein